MLLLLLLLRSDFTFTWVLIYQPRHRILELNGLKASDFPAEKQEQLLLGLLEESEKAWQHERCHVPHGTVKELDRYFYRTVLQTNASVTQVEKSEFSVSAELSNKDLKALKTEAGPEVKIEFPHVQELKAALKVANAAVKKLEGKASELAALTVTLEADSKLSTKKPEVAKAGKELEKFLKDLRKTAILGEKKCSSMDDKKALAEIDNVRQWNDDAGEHLDNVTALIRRMKGWLS